MQKMSLQNQITHTPYLFSVNKQLSKVYQIEMQHCLSIARNMSYFVVKNTFMLY